MRFGALTSVGFDPSPCFLIITTLGDRWHLIVGPGWTLISNLPLPSPPYSGTNGRVQLWRENTQSPPFWQTPRCDLVSFSPLGQQMMKSFEQREI